MSFVLPEQTPQITNYSNIFFNHVYLDDPLRLWQILPIYIYIYIYIKSKQLSIVIKQFQI